MKIIVVGASGTIGKAVVEALEPDHQILKASRKGEVNVDLSNPNSIKDMYNSVSNIDAVLCAAGGASFGSLNSFSDKDFDFGLGNKLMGQVNLVRYGIEYLNENGVFTLNTGILAHSYSDSSVMLTMINRGLEGFVESAALGMPKNQKINAVWPPMVKETAEKLGWGPGGMPAAEVAQFYVQSLSRELNGSIIGPMHSK